MELLQRRNEDGGRRLHDGLSTERDGAVE